MAESMNCQKCGAEFGANNMFCGKCGWSVGSNTADDQLQSSQQPYMPQQQYDNPNNRNVYVTQNVVHKGNGCGTAGFVLALLGLFLGWIPYFGWIMWLLGAILSFVGLFKAPRGLAIAGFIISFISIIIIIAVLYMFGIGVMSFLYC